MHCWVMSTRWRKTIAKSSSPPQGAQKLIFLTLQLYLTLKENYMDALIPRGNKWRNNEVSNEAILGLGRILPL